MLLGAGGTPWPDSLRPVFSPAVLFAAIAAVREVNRAPAVADYVIDIAAATRNHPEVVLGASPRASLSLLHAAKAHAAMSGRHFVVPGDVQVVAVPSLAHRLMLAGGGDPGASNALVARLVETLPVPRG